MFPIMGIVDGYYPRVDPNLESKDSMQLHNSSKIDGSLAQETVFYKYSWDLVSKIKADLLFFVCIILIFGLNVIFV